jgi:tRNA (cytidine56-2'-O)-methyltransferase
MITILRLGHRIFRDQRITSHVFLAARALGADNGIYTGEKDQNTEQSIAKVTSQWGGSFRIRHSEGWKQEFNKFKGVKIHLTVYGLPFHENMKEIRKKTKNKKIMLIVGGEKVPPEVYQQSDFNISVTSQPHSEIAGLALFLHEYFQGKELDKKFPKAHLKVVPQERGKKTVKK